jgi:type IV pilus assembly protein PilV
MKTSFRPASEASSKAAPSKAEGFMLLEALFGILLFSLGIIALIGLQANSIKQSIAGQYRSEASMLAEQLIGQMWASNRSADSLEADFNSSHIGNTTCTSGCGDIFGAWYTQVTAALPGSIDNPPTIVFTTVTGSSVTTNSTKATITMYWRAPTEDQQMAAHKYIVITQLR